MLNIYEEYSVLESQIKALNAKKETLRSDIIKDMLEKGEDKKEMGVGKFTISRLKKWVYPAKVTELEEKFKAAKAKSESTGEAKYTEVESLRYTSVEL